MMKFLSIIDKWGLRICLFLTLIIFFKTCNTNNKVESVKKEVQSLNGKVDTLGIDLKKEIKVEGLKSEKRMIQSTDRKMIDVNSQASIDQEIQKLESK